jgi:carbon storage regulator CsrA
MLILARKKNERLMIFANGEKVTITVVEGTHVRLGVDASRGVGVYREELLAADGRPRAVPVAPAQAGQ